MRSYILEGPHLAEIKGKRFHGQMHVEIPPRGICISAIFANYENSQTFSCSLLNAMSLKFPLVFDILHERFSSVSRHPLIQ